jgi:septum formation protein
VVTSFRPPLGLILASTSAYRRALLARLGLRFDVHGSQVDEAPLAGEAPRQRAERLALAKAQAIASSYPEHVVIGADQVACCDGLVLDKPGDASSARTQLRRQSGRSIEFFSAVAVICAQRGHVDRFVDLTTVHMRALSDAEIAAYVAADEPFDCAGSLRSEALGVALCERIESQDPTGLIGLPLIRLGHALRACGYALP